MNMIDKSANKKISEQIKQEYKLCYDDQQEKIKKNLRRLKLFNNQSRHETLVGDPLLFTVFQTVFSALYDDKMSIVFEPNEEGDIETAEDITALAEHDYNKMEKSETDYYWDWDTCFFGRGLLLLNDFDYEENMCPIPEVMDPMTFLRDPNASSVNGDARGRGAMRFGGREIALTKWQMEEMGYDTADLKKEREYDELLNEAKQQRAEAQGTQNQGFQDELIDENYEYTVLEWYTHVKGKKCIVSLGNRKSKVLRIVELEGDNFPIIDRALFPVSKDWDGVSIPDLIEDKQRARAKMLNLGMEAAMADLHPQYLYDKTKITNKADLDIKKNKAVGVNGSVAGAFQPMQTANSVSQQVQYIYNVLDIASQKAVSAPEIAQGVSPTEGRTATENELVASARGARMSLALAIWGWSERRFWNQWYNLYKQNYKDELGEKVIRIKGSMGNSFRKLTRENIIASKDPDITVKSKRSVEAKRKSDIQEYMQVAQLALQDPEANRKYIMRRLARLSNLKQDEINMMFPFTPEEIKAIDENDLLSDDKFVKVDPTDDDMAHLEQHQKAAHTPAKLAHIQAHKMMIKLKAQRPEVFGSMQQGNEDLEDVTPINSPQQNQQRRSRGEMLAPNSNNYEE